MTRHICRNCHFLAKECRDETGSHIFSVSIKEREKASKGEANFVGEHYSLKCYLGVWDEGVNPDIEKRRLNIINKIKRQRKCFFFPHDPDMLFGAAKELQRREQENQQLKRSNLYTRIGLWIAVIALLLNAIISIFRHR